MLNDIKGIIKQKADFLEAAAIIFEDGSGQNLDDVIILGEETDVPPSPQEESSDDDNLPKKDSTEGEDDESSEEPEEGKEDKGDEDHPDTDGDGEVEDIGDLPIEDPEGAPAEPQNDEDDLLNADIDEQPMPLPGSDLPTPMGAQTGEPVNPLDDILNVEIDLGSNTVKDVLPVPPANANEALADGSDTQHVDSGFGESKEEPKKNPKEDPKAKTDDKSKSEEKDIPVKESAKPFWESFFSKPGDNFSEAITLGDEPSAEPAPPAEDPGSAPATEDPAAEPVATSGEEESEVTSAVRDKVAEVESPAPAESGDGAKEDLLKKLGNITKNLEDAKKAVMSAIQ